MIRKWKQEEKEEKKASTPTDTWKLFTGKVTAKRIQFFRMSCCILLCHTGLMNMCHAGYRGWLCPRVVQFSLHFYSAQAPVDTLAHSLQLFFCFANFDQSAAPSALDVNQQPVLSSFATTSLQPTHCNCCEWALFCKQHSQPENTATLYRRVLWHASSFPVIQVTLSFHILI